LKSTFTAFATGKAGLLLRTLLTEPVVLVCVAVSAALGFAGSDFAGAAGTAAGVSVVVCPETL
jgi:hypothetical protein